MWLPTTPRDRQHGFRRSPATREAPGDADPYLHCLRGPDESLQHGESRRAVKIKQKFGCLERSTHTARQLHDGMMTRVTGNVIISKAFAVTNGAKQGCVLASTLFRPMCSATLIDAYCGEHHGIRTTYRSDDNLFNSKDTQAKTELLTTTVYDLLFTDDRTNFKLIININKTVVKHKPPPNTQPCTPPRITVNG
nr:unnamed protein product [Spirometra erinaceieuropaei]